MTWDPFLESPGNLAMPGWRPYPKIMILTWTLAPKPVLLLKHYYQNLRLGLWIYCKHKIAFLGTANTGTLLGPLVAIKLRAHEDEKKCGRAISLLRLVPVLGVGDLGTVQNIRMSTATAAIQDPQSFTIMWHRRSAKPNDHLTRLLPYLRYLTSGS